MSIPYKNHQITNKIKAFIALRTYITQEQYWVKSNTDSEIAVDMFTVLIRTARSINRKE